jgi:hypothetical protein
MRSRDPPTAGPGPTIASRVSTSQPPLALAWQRHSEAGAAGRAEAVVPRPARARLDVVDRDSARFAGRRFRASTITSCVGTDFWGPLRPRSPGCRLATHSGHLVPAGTRAAPYRPKRWACWPKSRQHCPARTAPRVGQGCSAAPLAASSHACSFGSAAVARVSAPVLPRRRRNLLLVEQAKV